MPRFECEASIHFDFIVTAATKEEAEALLAEQLGPDWGTQCDQPDDIAHPQIEQGTYGTDVLCIGPVEDEEAEGAKATQTEKQT
jgi:hypothetical protein